MKSHFVFPRDFIICQDIYAAHLDDFLLEITHMNKRQLKLMKEKILQKKNHKNQSIFLTEIIIENVENYLKYIE